MTIHIFKKPIVDEECLTNRLHTPFRSQMKNHSYLEDLKKVVEGRHVIEIACGVFGGLAKKVLEFGCESYTGIDISPGDPDEKTTETFLSSDRISSLQIPCVVSISEKIANDPRTNFFFGIDAVAYFSQYVKSESVVTISTGFFHDEYLMPDGNGEQYVENIINQIARVTIRGFDVGLHHFMLDRTPNIQVFGADEGLIFRYLFKKYGMYPYSHRGNWRPTMWTLKK